MRKLATVQGSRYELEPLEPRIMLSGEGASGAAPMAPTTRIEIVEQNDKLLVSEDLTFQTQATTLFEGEQGNFEEVGFSEKKEADVLPFSILYEGEEGTTSEISGIEKDTETQEFKSGEDFVSIESALEPENDLENLSSPTALVIPGNVDAFQEKKESESQDTLANYFESTEVDENNKTVVKQMEASTTSASSSVFGDENKQFVFTAEAGGNDFLLRLNPDNSAVLELVDQKTKAVLIDSPLMELESVVIKGSNTGDDFLTVDFSTPFWIGGGIRYEGGDGYLDSLAFKGNDLINLDYTAIGVDAGFIKVSEGEVELDIEFVGLEPVTVSNLGSYTFNTSNANIFPTHTLPTSSGVDTILIDSPAEGQNRISGTSGGQIFENVTFFNVGEVIINLGDNDTAGNDQDTVTVSSDGIVASELQNFSILTGDGDDIITINVSDISLPVSGGAFSLDAGSGQDAPSHTNLLGVVRSQASLFGPGLLHASS